MTKCKVFYTLAALSLLLIFAHIFIEGDRRGPIGWASLVAATGALLFISDGVAP